MMRSFHIPTVILIALFTFAGANLLSSCGQKGALKLPPKVEPAAPLKPNSAPNSLPPKLEGGTADTTVLNGRK